jgi:chromosome partitioning protein
MPEHIVLGKTFFAMAWKGRLMPILAVVNQKGGTGKTTVATNLATLFAGQKGEVLLVDADPQQSALEWQHDRPASLPQVAVIGLPAPNLQREIPRLQTKYGVILIDGGGRVTATARATVAVADFLLVPTLASLPDARSTQRFFQEVIEAVAAIKGRISGAMLFTMVKTGTVFNVSGQSQMKDLGYPVLETTLSHRITYQEAFAQGMGVGEYDPRSKAAEEMQAVFREVQEGL